MFNISTELFLQTYFLFEAMAGKLTGEGKSLFDKLYSIFLLPEAEKEALLKQTLCEEVREIETYGNYAQICRIRKYSELTDCVWSPAFDLSDIIAIKGGVLRKVKQEDGGMTAETTEAAAYKRLSESAAAGHVTALCVLGFLQCEGIFVEKNERLGTKNLERAARWNSIEGMLLSLYYNEKNRKTNLSRLYTVTRGTLSEEIYTAAAAAYGAKEAHVLAENRMLQKAFGAGILKPELYVSQHSRFIFSEILSPKDKERALFSENQTVIAETADLPLKLTFGNIAFDSSALDELPLVRDRERREISRCNYNADMRGEPAYRTLCVSGDSNCLVKLYMSALGKAFPGAHIEKIDVADLNEYDFEPTKNNVFVRSCDEDRQNVYLIYFHGEIREGVMSAVKSFLQSDKRKRFRLQHPSAVIDLSAILPVCFCDRQNARLLKTYCDVVSLAPVSEGEMPDMVEYILQTKAEQYKMGGVSADRQAREMLVRYSVDRAESLVDKAVRFNRGEGVLTVTAEMLKEFAGAETTGTKFGFGGADNESK